VLGFILTYEIIAYAFVAAEDEELQMISPIAIEAFTYLLAIIWPILWLYTIFTLVMNKLNYE
jgi:hypothetical protein